jgi:hypothetical protein
LPLRMGAPRWRLTGLTSTLSTSCWPKTNSRYP